MATINQWWYSGEVAAVIMKLVFFHWFQVGNLEATRFPKCSWVDGGISGNVEKNGIPQKNSCFFKSFSQISYVSPNGLCMSYRHIQESLGTLDLPVASNVLTCHWRETGAKTLGLKFSTGPDPGTNGDRSFGTQTWKINELKRGFSGNFGYQWGMCLCHDWLQDGNIM